MNDLLLHKSKDHEGDLTKISPEFLKRKLFQLFGHVITILPYMVMLSATTYSYILELPKTEKNSPNPELDETLIACPECKVNIPLHSLGSHMSQLHKPLHKVVCFFLFFFKV